MFNPKIWLIISITHGYNFFVLSDIPRPRGVSISKAPLYVPTDGRSFVCLDGLKTIPFSRLNDDFCDCLDGSDEPGTAACPTGTFHCTNVGHRPVNIPSSRINDGICDCCDGSDEYEGKGKCDNVCGDLGREESLREKQKLELAKQGTQLRLTMSTKGKALKEQQKARLNELNRSKDEAEALRNEHEAIKKSLEEKESDALAYYRELQEEEDRIRIEREATQNAQEADEIFQKYDSNQDGLIDYTELQTRITFDRNRDGAVSVEEAKYFLDEHDQVDQSTFTTLCWPKMKPFIMLESGIFKPPATVDEIRTDEHHLDPSDPTEEHEEYEHDDHDPEEPEDIDEELEEGEDEETGVGSIEKQNPDQPTGRPQPEYDDDTKQLITEATEARNRFNTVDREYRDILSEIKDLEEQLEKDYGPNEEFAALNGECFDFEDREYIYKVCPFDRAVQQQKSGGGETRLGAWERWDGPETNRYSTMLFANGASCWNGPQRSAIVHLDCGLDTRVTSVSEPNRCEYVYTMETPALCSVYSDTSEDSHEHDEL